MNSYNGWRASRSPAAIGVKPFEVVGREFPAGVKTGPVAVVLGYVAEQFHLRVEPLVNPGCWGYNYRANRNNPSNLSCHASGTAVDVNAPRHPNGRRGTFSKEQVAEIRRILAEVRGVVEWGADFSTTPDEMHFEISGSVAEVAAVAKSLSQPQEDDVMSPGQEAEQKEIRKRVDKLQATVEAVDRHLLALAGEIKTLLTKSHPGTG